MPKALIIDDEAALTTIIGRFLNSAGFSVETATSGPEGLGKAVSGLPDVVIVDVMMPDMDGYEVCRRLRRDPRTARVAILVLTARGQLIDKEIALRAGADVHMPKPYQGKALVREVRRLLAEKPSPGPPLGYQILLLRLKEGVGATTLATNLSLCLADDEKQLIVVADMVLKGGQVESRLGLPPTKAWQEGHWNHADDLAERLVRHESGLFALPAPLLNRVQPTPQEVKQILQILREWHDYVVVDTPLNLGTLAPALLRSSPLILLLLTPDPALLQASQASLTAIKKLGNHSLQVWPILNMAKPEQRAFESKIREVLGLSVAGSLPWAPGECAQAISDGKPVVLGHPHSPLAVAIQELAQAITQAADKRPLKRIPR